MKQASRRRVVQHPQPPSRIAQRPSTLGHGTGFDKGLVTPKAPPATDAGAVQPVLPPHSTHLGARPGLHKRRRPPGTATPSAPAPLSPEEVG